MNIKHITAIVSLDLEKAFDTIYTDALIYRLSEMDLPVRIIQLIHSYTSNRHFKVHANHQTSSIRPITAGVPQGSALGPVLYSLYINDIPKPVDHRVTNALYADDTAIMVKSLNVQILGKLLQNHLNLLDEYFLEYGLKVNVDKCQATLFTRKLKIIPPKITLSNRELVWTRQTKYLGVTLDKNLSFRPHIKNIVAAITPLPLTK